MSGVNERSVARTIPAFFTVNSIFPSWSNLTGTLFFKNRCNYDNR